jgi:hypothetical protein
MLKITYDSDPFGGPLEGKRKKKKKAAANKGYSMLRMTGKDRHEFLRQAEKTIAERNRRIVDELVDA